VQQKDAAGAHHRQVRAGLACAVSWLSVCAGSAFLVPLFRFVMTRAMPCCVVRLQIRLQSSASVDFRISLSHRRGFNHFESALAVCLGASWD